MLVVSRFRVVSTVIICLLGLIFALPSVVDQKTFDRLPSFLQHTVNLGLELRGGSHIQLEADIKSVEKEHQESIIDEARKQLRKNNIKYNRISVQVTDKGSSILIALNDVNDIPKVTKILSKIEPELEVTSNGPRITAVLSQTFFDNFAKRIVDESIEVIRHRIDESGTKEPTILKQGTNRITVQLPGVDNPAEIKKLLGKTAILTFHGVDEEMQSIQVKDGIRPHLPTKPGVMYLPEEKGNGMKVYVPIKKQISLTGKSLVDAQMGIDQQTGMPCVHIKFDSIDGTRKIAELSTKYLHKQFAMVLDGKVLSAPVFQAVLTGGSAQITGHFSMEEATELALLLRAGSLPAPLNVVEERSVGPSLGADSIADGKNATIFAFILVSLFMILSYGLFGFFSVISLSCNITLLFACLTLLGATLTLPGIAGIALTIGMAVDSNVLIYERIREEIRAGIKASVAIAKGYKMAMMTILDSNLTTLVGSIVLYEFGSGPIKGFAVTLALGTVISLFTTFSLTKSIIALWMRRNRHKEIVI
ncbi:MAG: protein translocase subunit SecD [Holosporales bacterium]|jgi:preprotein translocase subunit SecD|nr:protein translocase subunit SecD [Holosporales bacterium]